MRKSYRQLKGRGLVGSCYDAYASLRLVFYSTFLSLPGVRSKVQASLDDAVTKMEAKLLAPEIGMSRYLSLPKEGWTEEQIRAELEKLGDLKHTRWEDGRVSGAVYHGGSEIIDLQAHAFAKFSVANPIHPDVFPGVRKMEAEIVAMVLSLFSAPPSAAGVTTSGGTESILMTCLSARQKAYTEKGITAPEMIVPTSAHAAFHKAAEYFSIKIHLVDCPSPDFAPSIPSISRLINDNTILIVGSAPSFPHGIIDDIPSLSKLALRKKIPLHVDACLGSFLLPFLSPAGFIDPPIPEFDFRLKGVTSISVDTHKYGFAPKGNSTLLYRNKQLRSYQYFISPNWSGGVYASPSIAGSRPGALIAGCWASLMTIGESGYRKACGEIVGATRRFERAIREDALLKEELEVCGHPLVSVVAFQTKRSSSLSSSSSSSGSALNIYDIADNLSGKGWHLSALQNPPGLHVAFTLPMVTAVDKLIEELIIVVEEEREKERVRVVEGKTKNVGGGVVGGEMDEGKDSGKGGDAAALYGVAGALPDKRLVKGLATGFLDCLYKA